MLELIILATALGWLAVAFAMLPAFWRLMTGHTVIYDPFRALLFFIAISRIGISMIGFRYGHTAATAEEVFARTGVAALSFTCALATLWLTYVYRRG